MTAKQPEEKFISKNELDEKLAKMEEFYLRNIEELSRNKVEAKLDEVKEIESSTNGTVKLDDYVDIINLCPMPLNLSTEGSGKGRLFRFQKFGERKSILYRDLVDIIESHRTFLEAGYFYILNKDVIRKNGLDYIYDTILTKENILEILDGNKATAISLYESANEKQKEMIVEMLLDKISKDPESVDMNVVDKISKISKIDLVGKVNSSKEIFEMEDDENSK